MIKWVYECEDCSFWTTDQSSFREHQRLHEFVSSNDKRRMKK